MTTCVSGGVRAARALVAGLACGAMVLLAGCGSDAEEVRQAGPVPPPVESSVEATAEPSEAPAESEIADGSVREEGDGETGGRTVDDVVLQEGGPATGEVDLEGAKNAAHGILAAYFGGLANGSTHNVKALGSNQCEFCKKAIIEIEDLDRDGLRLSPDFTWEITELRSGSPLEEGAEHIALVKYTTENFDLVDEEGNVVGQADQGERQVMIGARLTERGWLIDLLSSVTDEEYANISNLMED